MKKKEFLEKARKDINWACDYLEYNGNYDIVHENTIKALIIDELNESVTNYNLVVHLAQAMQEDSETSYYNYDTCMGTLEELTPIDNFQDIEDLVIDVNDNEDI